MAHSYIEDTEHAVTKLLELISEEQTEYDRAREHMDFVERQSADPTNTDSPAEEFSRRFGAWARADRAAHASDARLTSENKLTSLRTLAGAVLQIAKQGLSTVHGRNRAIGPTGRCLGNLEMPIRDIIWCSRNQSMHFEEGRYNPDVVDCFETLSEIDSKKFDLAARAHENLALDVLRLLNWRRFEDYARDMEELLSATTSPVT